ncbi:TRAP transporter substrate-binding protein DctP [Suttonella sp. R2A3]|uniref:TRAP transporter substrate-binding protein n=1 Tax=Suttonella sp. R2A3 TaxID=2908648 RepID=UPI001F413AC9|nr:TRAP transporter substrate-binding protein DctP [Suttonella sp. R2A3]UJF23773.1 TRAP transporter substrate-binding protein DctP [Suttonella sp. R2A3]
MNKILLTTAIAALTSASAMGDTWKYAIEESMDDVQGVFAQSFKNYVEENSDHDIKIYPYGTLGESDDALEQAQAGIIEFVDQSPGFTGSLIPEAQIFFVPYLQPTEHDKLVKFFRESKVINDEFPAIYAEQGLTLLKMFPEGELVITTKEPFTSPEEFEGMKIRVMTNPLVVETYKAFGATPTPLPWGEVYGALQTNIVQGQENPLFWVDSAKLYEVTDVITFTGHNNFTTAVMANQDFYQGLSEEDQQLIADGMSAAFDEIVDYQKGLGEKSLANIQEKKPEIEVVELTDEQRQAFIDTREDVEAIYIEQAGERGKKLLEAFKADLDAVQ